MAQLEVYQTSEYLEPFPCGDVQYLIGDGELDASKRDCQAIEK